MKKRYSGLLFLIFFACLLLAGLIGGVALDRVVFNRFIPPAGVPKESIPDFRLMAEAWNIIRGFYVDQESAAGKKLAYGAIGGMVDSLGDRGHSRFIPPEGINAMKGIIKGQFVGVGIELQTTDDKVTVVAPLDSSPAQEAGVRPGDIITRVDDRDVAGLSTEEVAKLVKGPAGSPVKLGILTPSTGVNRVLRLTRRNLPIHNVTSTFIPGTKILHIRISSFGNGTAQDLKETLKPFRQADRGGLEGIILDLRRNPGGLLEEAVSVASQFVPNGPVVLVKGPKNKTKQMDAEPVDQAPSVPVAVVMDEGTASAAEIVAGALQDRNRATLVGEKTVGTGTVLRQFFLTDGSAILLATYEWMTPSGQLIWHKGLTPNVSVALPHDGKILSPRAERVMTGAQVRTSTDKQLLTALQLLENKHKQ